jgi:protein AbiQ
MKIKKLKLYYISEDYIKYLRKYDNKLPSNKNTKRPYIGIVYQYNGFNYFAPLS